MHQQPGSVLSRDLTGDSAAFCSSDCYIHNMAKAKGVSTMSRQCGHFELRACKDPLEKSGLIVHIFSSAGPKFQKKTKRKKIQPC